MSARAIGTVTTTTVVVVSANSNNSRELTALPETPEAAAAHERQFIAAEQHVPEGRGAILHEAGLLPWVIGVLALAGLAAVGISLWLIGGPQASIVGIVWVLMGYAVVWSVVWGAGVFRAHDERDVEEHIIRGDWKSDRR